MQVKVILHRGPSEEVLPRKEIRRFFLEKLDSFQHLKDQVIMLYDDLTADTTLRFLWTDEEGDNVQFSSDKEMKEAVNFFQNQQGENKLFKLIVRFPQPPPPPAAQKGRANQGAQGNGNDWKDPAKMEKKIQKIHERQCKKNMMSSIRAAAAAGQPLESLLNNFHSHFNRIMAPEGGHSSPSSSSTGEVIPIQHADGTVTCNGATVTSTSTTSSTTTNDKPMTSTQTNTSATQSEKQTSNPAQDDFEDVSAELKQQKMKEAIAKMNELGFEGEWVVELLKSVDGDVVRAVTAMNPDK